MESGKPNVVQDLVFRCQAGDHRAFDQLVDLYASRCYGYFYRLTGNADTSHDLLGDLFVKLVEKIRLFKGGSFEKWLFTIAANLFHDHLRERYRQKKMLESKIREESDEPLPRRADGDLSDKLQRVLAKLDEDTVQVIMMRFYGDLSFKELAEIRQEPIGTTLSKAHRGLKKLRELMGEIGE